MDDSNIRNRQSSSSSPWSAEISNNDMDMDTMKVEQWKGDGYRKKKKQNKSIFRRSGIASVSGRIGYTIIALISITVMLDLIFSSKQSLSTFTDEIENSVESTSTNKQDNIVDETLLKCPKQKYKKPFDPFTEFRFQKYSNEASTRDNNETMTTDEDDTTSFTSKTVAPVQHHQEHLKEKNFYSSYHCMGTGSVYDNAEISQTDKGSYHRKHGRPNLVNRQCNYKNLYYHIKDQTFHYFASPIESKLWQQSRNGMNHDDNEVITRMEVSLGVLPEQVISEKIDRIYGTPWKPILHETTADFLPNSISFAEIDTVNTDHDNNDTTTASTPIFALYQPIQASNFGQLLWNDILGIYTLLDRFGYGHDITKQVIPFLVELPTSSSDNDIDEEESNDSDGDYINNQWQCSTKGNHEKWSRCVNMYQRVHGPLLGVQPDICSGDVLRSNNFLQGEASIGVWSNHEKNNDCVKSHVGESVNNTTQLSTVQRNEPPTNVDYVLLPNVVAGMGRTGFIGCDQDCSLGRTNEYYGFRNFLLRNMIGPKEVCKYYELQPPKGYITFALYIPANKSPNMVYQFEQEIELAKKKYGNEIVKVVDMSRLSVVKQAKLIAQTAILITNQGSVSSASVFLPRGGSAIVYWNGKKKVDHHWFESAGYFRTNWISIEERQYVNRTMTLIDDQFMKSIMTWQETYDNFQINTTSFYV